MAAGYGKEGVLWASLLTKTEERSSFGGEKGAVVLGREDLNFPFIAAMKLRAGRLAKRGL